MRIQNGSCATARINRQVSVVSSLSSGYSQLDNEESYSSGSEGDTTTRLIANVLTHALKRRNESVAEHCSPIFYIVITHSFISARLVDGQKSEERPVYVENGAERDSQFGKYSRDDNYTKRKRR